MNRTRRTATGLLAATLAVSAAVLAAQARPTTPQENDTASEIRALRAEMKERLDANIRVQLLVARLQLQEQRTTSVIRELQSVDDKLRENQRVRDQIDAGLKMFGGIAALEEKKNEDNFMFSMFRNQVEQATRTDGELKAQQAQLNATLAEEQARWNAFNARLDEIEKTLLKR